MLVSMLIDWFVYFRNDWSEILYTQQPSQVTQNSLQNKNTQTVRGLQNLADEKVSPKKIGQIDLICQGGDSNLNRHS